MRYMGDKEDDPNVVVEFLLPCKDKGGADLTGLIEEFLASIYPEFNWTYAGLSEGIWPSKEGPAEFDTCKRYFVITEMSKVGLLEKYLVKKFKQRTKQDKILLLVNLNVQVKFL